jgi:hypothetical protein
MLAEAELMEYLDEIREKVCSHCVERPYGGPPCGPLGKPCGVEMHLEKLVESIREIHSPLIAPYLDNNRCKICSSCPHLNTEFCPCPMDTLAVLVAEAVEAVDERHAHPAPQPPPVAPSDRLKELREAYEEAIGMWTGCDWPTHFGEAQLDLQGVSASDARAVADGAGEQEREIWEQAARWLLEVERRAKLAEREAELAIVAAQWQRWDQAAEHARRAWSLEFHTGRPLRREMPTWRRLYQVARAASLVGD